MAQQVLTHAARGWTLGAGPCRDRTDGWILRRLVEHCSSHCPTATTNLGGMNVLVPVVGSGRLAYNISTCLGPSTSRPTSCRTSW